MEYFNLEWRRASWNYWSNLRWLSGYVFHEKNNEDQHWMRGAKK